MKQLALQKIHGRAGLHTPGSINTGMSLSPVPGSNLFFLFQALKRQSSLGLSFFNSILAHGDLRNNRLNQLSVNLWHLAQRHGCVDTRTMVRCGVGQGGPQQAQRAWLSRLVMQARWPGTGGLSAASGPGQQTAPISPSRKVPGPTKDKQLSIPTGSAPSDLTNHGSEIFRGRTAPECFQNLNLSCICNY